MDGNQKKDRIYVMPNSVWFYIPDSLLIIMLVVAIREAESLVDMVIMGTMDVTALLFGIYMQFSRKLIAGPRGIVFHKLWRPTVRTRYSQITKIEVTFYMRVTSLRFFKGRECIGLCYSSDTNYSRLFSFLTEAMPERITYKNSKYA